MNQQAQLYTYQFNEGQLILPEAYQDDSVQILKLPHKQTNLIITRTILKAQQTEDSYFKQQIALLKKEMRHLIVGDRVMTTLGGERAIEAKQVQIQFENKGVVLYQFLLTTVRPDSSHLLVLTYSQPRPLTEADNQCWQAIKDSFIPA